MTEIDRPTIETHLPDVTYEMAAELGVLVSVAIARGHGETKVGELPVEIVKETRFVIQRLREVFGPKSEPTTR